MMLPATYISLMLPKLTEVFVVFGVLGALYIFVIIPANAFTLMVIAKTKKLWTPSNMVLVINGFFQIMGSAVMLVCRFSVFPFPFFNEDQRELLHIVEWLAYTLTFRMSCTWYVSIKTLMV